MSAHQLKQLLDEVAQARVPDGVDLWPAIDPRARRDAAGRPAAPAARPRPASRRVIRLALAAGAVLAAVLALLFLPAGPETTPASAAPLLNHMADVAAAQPAGGEPGGRYRYVKSEEAYLAMASTSDRQLYSILVPKVREIWIAADGSGRIREAAEEPIFLGPRDRALWEAAGSPALAAGINQDFGPGGLSYEDFSQYPLETAALTELIRRKAVSTSGPPVNEEMLVIVGDLLRQPGVPPELRAALFRVAAGIPGVQLVGPVADRLGRAGVAVAMAPDYTESKRLWTRVVRWRPGEPLAEPTAGSPHSQQQRTLIIDPQTSALLGEEIVLLTRVDWVDAEPPAVIGYAVYLDSGFVAELPR
jgi:hypothetical protein